MSAKSAPRSSSPYDFQGQFLCLSLIAITVVTILSSIMLSRFLKTEILEQDASVMQAFVHSFMKVELASSYFRGEQTSDENYKEFFRHVASMPDVARANVYSEDKRLLWSSNPELIGKQFGHNPELELALTGKIQIKSGSIGDDERAKPEHVALSNSGVQFVEIYIPVTDPESGDIIGAVEIYRIPDALFKTIQLGHRMIWTVAALSGAFLLVTLFGMVRRADLVIRTQQERLIETETLSALGEVASAVAHGIRNPLASIRSSAELWHNAEESTVRESAQDIMSEVDRLEKWIRELLIYSQPSEDQIMAVALPPVVHESVVLFTRESEKRSVKISAVMQEKLSLISGDPALLLQVFNNLIANALDASQPGGVIIVRAKNCGDNRHVELEFSDTGTGISPNHLAKVGNTFFTTKQKGLGVGLALVKRVVKRFGGKVAINSRQGAGTTVTLTFLCAN